MWDRFFYGVCYYPEQWAPVRHASDISRIAKCGFNYVRMGEGAWSYFQPQEGDYQFDLFDRVITQCRKHDIKIIMGTPTYAAPAWVSAKYPEVLRWSYERIPMAHGSRRNLNYTSPKYLELCDSLVTALAKHYKSERQIIGWQIDNEFNCHMDASYAPSDTAAFREWLKEKYKTLDALNAAWGASFWSQTYSDWEQIDLPHPTAAPHNPTQLLDESRFISDCVVRFAQRQVDILRKHNPRWLLTHNGLFPNVDGEKLVKVLDFFSHDQYPLFTNSPAERASWLVTARSLSFPFGIMEQQAGPGGQLNFLQRTPRPSELRLWVWQSIIHGAKALGFFRWRTCPFGAEQHWHGLLDQDDRDNRRISEARRIGKELATVPKAFFDAPPVKCIAVMRDFDNEANDRRINTYVSESRSEGSRWLAQVAARHIPGDFVWSGSSIRGYRIVVAPHLKIMPPQLIEKLEQFARGGGTVVLCAQSGSKDVNCHVVEKPLPGLLAKAAGIEVEDWTALGKGETRQASLATGEMIALGGFVERLKPTTAEVVARWANTDSLLAHAPAITRNAFGGGSVYYIGGYCSEASIAKLLDPIIREQKIKSIAEAAAEVEVIVRSNARKTWYCLLNHSTQPQRVRWLPPCHDVLTGTKYAEGQITLDPYGVVIAEA